MLDPHGGNMYQDGKPNESYSGESYYVAHKYRSIGRCRDDVCIW